MASDELSSHGRLGFPRQDDAAIEHDDAPADYVYLLNDSRAKALFIHASLWKSVQQLLPQLKYLRHVIVVGLEQEGESETTALHDFERWTSRASSQLEAAETSKDDSAFWLYSSGSIGFPKGCIHLQHDMVYTSARTAAVPWSRATNYTSSTSKAERYLAASQACSW